MWIKIQKQVVEIVDVIKQLDKMKFGIKGCSLVIVVMSKTKDDF